jgi:ABC-type transport system involved in multi-copper enzyme maturation permease subunit
MFPIAWITLRRITERSMLVQFGILALVLAYIALGLDSLVLSDAAATAQDGLMVILLFLTAFTVFWTTMEIPRELERKEAAVYLSKPISRMKYLLGKFIGMTGMTLAGEAALLGVFTLCLLLKGVHPSASTAFTAARTALFLIMLNALCCFASVWMGEVRGMCMVGAVFFLGIGICAVPVFAWSSFHSAAFWNCFEIAHYGVPDLLHYRWEPPPELRRGYLADLLIYTAGWCILFLGLSRTILVYKDLS